MNDNGKHSTIHHTSVFSRRRVWIGLVLVATAVFIVWFFFSRPNDVDLSLSEQQHLLELAREQLIASIAGEGSIDVDRDTLPDQLLRDGVAFVSLTVDGALRGCMIDQFEPHEPLFVNVLHNVQLAVGADDRFPAIMQDEIDDVRIKVSIVHKVNDVSFGSPDELLEQLAPQEDGIILKVASELAAYLPYVWGIISDPDIFLEQLCIKAGWEPDRWRTEPYPAVRTFQVYEFGEPD